MAKKTDVEIARKVVALMLKATPGTSDRINWKARAQAQALVAPHLARPEFLAELRAQALKSHDGDEMAARIFLDALTQKPKVPKWARGR